MRTSNWTQKGYQELSGHGKTKSYKESHVSAPLYHMYGIGLDINDFDSENKISILMGIEEAQTIIDQLQGQIDYRKKQEISGDKINLINNKMFTD